MVLRRIAVSARDTAAPAIAAGTADGSASHAAASRMSGSEATTPSTSGRWGCPQPRIPTSIGMALRVAADACRSPAAVEPDRAVGERARAALVADGVPGDREAGDEASGQAT